MRVCLLAALPSKAFLPPSERDARAPSTRNAGNAGVPPAMPTAREKTCPFERGGRGGLWSAEAELPPTLKLALQTCPRAAPLSHAVGEGLGVRAKQGASPCVPTPLLVRVHRFGTESLRQGRFSPRGRERVGAPCCPHPLCPPLPRGGRGGLWSAEARLPPTLKLTLQHSKHVRVRLPSPTLWERGWG